MKMISRKIGVKENTMILLYALDDGRPHTQKEICEEWLIPKTTLNTIVRECVKSGYLVLQPGSREKEIRLTEQGKAYAASVLNRVYNWSGAPQTRCRSRHYMNLFAGWKSLHMH